MDRPRCSVFLAVSLDGFIARRDGGLDWLQSFDKPEGPPDDHGFGAFFKTVDALVMGRGTWDVVRAFPEWPYGDKRVIVLTHRPDVGAHGEQFSAEAPQAIVERLGREGARRIYVDGGVVVRSFLRAGLVDDLTLAFIPRILGEGIPLFGEGVPDTVVRTIKATTSRGGMVQVTYEVVRG